MKKFSFRNSFVDGTKSAYFEHFRKKVAEHTLDD